MVEVFRSKIRVFSLLCMVTIGLVSCHINPITVDYFGQTKPDTIPVIFGEGIISQKGRLEHGISFTPDTKELAFGVLNKDDFRGDIYYSKKDGDKWSSPELFKPLKNKSAYLPYFSPNGQALLYTLSKWDTALYYKDLWIIEKNNQTWRNPERLKVPINPDASVSNACMSLNGTVYFTSNINCLGKENCNTADLFCSTHFDDNYQPVEAISELISPNDEESVFISPKEEYIIFCRYTDNKTMMDLYISYRNINNQWIEPQLIDSSINSTDWDRRPFVSNDNEFLFFTRLQIGMKGLTESDIYWVNTKKLFKPFVFSPLSDMTVQLGERFEISIPREYFKDIDDNELILSINQNDFDWLEFDREGMKLSGMPTQVGEYVLIFSAVDQHYNQTLDRIKISVMEF